MKLPSLFACCAALVTTLAYSVDAQEHAAFVPKPGTVAANQREDLAAERAGVVEVYKASGLRDPKWDAEAIEFLDGYCRLVANVPDQPKWSALRRQGKAVLDKGCQDPMVLTAYGLARSEGSSDRNAIDPLTKGVEGLKTTSYSRLRLAIAADELAQLLSAWKKDKESQAAYTLCADTFVAIAEDPKFSPRDEMYLFAKLQSRIDESLPRPIAQQIVDRIHAKRVRPWLADMVCGVWYVSKAWEARGNGFVNSVTPQGWKGFEENLKHARSYLEHAYELAPDRPYAPTILIKVAMGGETGPKDDIHTWFERATKAQFDWTPAYHSYLWALRPRWGGSHDAMISAAIQWAHSDRFDTDVPRQLIGTVNDVGQDLENHAVIWKRPGLFAEVDRVLERSIAEPAHAHEIDTLKTQRACFLWRNGKLDQARAVLDQLQQTWNRSAALESDVMKGDIAADVYLLTRPDAATVRAAIDAEKRGDSAAAVAEYLKVEQGLAPNDSPQVRDAIADRLAIARFNQSFQSGEWTSAPITTSLPAWRNLRGACSVGADSLLLIPESDGLNAAFKPRLGRRWEFEADLDFSHFQKTTISNAGVFLGFDHRNGDDRCISILIWPDRAETTVAYRYGRRNTTKLAPGPAEAPRKFRINVQAWDDAMLVKVNGATVFSGPMPLPASGWIPEDTISIGGHYAIDARIGDIQCSGIRLRKLAERPAEINTRRTAPKAEPGA